MLRERHYWMAYVVDTFGVSHVCYVSTVRSASAVGSVTVFARERLRRSYLLLSARAGQCADPVPVGPGCLGAGFPRRATWQRVLCGILRVCPLVRRLLLRGW